LKGCLPKVALCSSARLLTADHSGKGNNRIDREVQRTYVKATDLGYKGSIREWREVLMAWAAPKKDPMMPD